MKYRITSGFGDVEKFRSRPHTGVDFQMNTGEPLRAIKSGIAHVKDYGDSNAGKTVIIESNDGHNYIFGHLSKFNVQEGQLIKQGDLIGFSGNSGFSTGSHLHFGVREGNHFIDPSPYIDQIQNMNNLPNLQTAGIKVDFFHYFQQHMDLIGGFIHVVKLNIINLFTLSDYSPLIQLVKNLMQFLFINI